MIILRRDNSQKCEERYLMNYNDTFILDKKRNSMTSLKDKVVT